MQTFRHPANFIGFEDIFDKLNRAKEQSQPYPPYNVITLDENKYCVQLALAGYAPEDIEATKVKNSLIIEGKPSAGENVKYLHKGISSKSFKREFDLSPDVEVREVEFVNGLLNIYLETVIPEKDMPTKLKINSKKQFLAE